MRRRLALVSVCLLTVFVSVEAADRGRESSVAWSVRSDGAEGLRAEPYAAEAFAFHRVPRLYDEGARQARPQGSRAFVEADVRFPLGTHRLLVRHWASSRLVIDGEEVAATRFHGMNGAHNPFEFPVGPVAGEAIRRAAPGHDERLATFTTDGGVHRVTFDFTIGKTFAPRVGFDGRPAGGEKAVRADLEETTVAVCFEGEQRWYLLTPRPRRLRYDDATWHDLVGREDVRYDAIDYANRRRSRAADDEYWALRHTAAANWAAGVETPAVPAPADGFDASTEVDAFLASQFVSERSAGGDAYAVPFGPVAELLETHCVRCHRGDEPSGGLLLDDPSQLVATDDAFWLPVTAGDVGASTLFERITSDDPDVVMPPPEGGEPLADAEVAVVREWIEAGASTAVAVEPTVLAGPLDDLAFLRKVTLDIVGFVPTPAEIDRYQADPPATRRSLAVDRLLADRRAAGHRVGYWQDVLAENPSLVKPTLNNTGPFRFWLHEAFLDKLPFDRFVTELLSLWGGPFEGGSSGFGVATENDAPLAARGVVLASAFLGENLACARCHDAPFHRGKQADLFAVASMLNREPTAVPETSTVDLSAFANTGREPLIEVTLAPGEPVPAAWPFRHLVDLLTPAEESWDGRTPREELAYQITRPENRRFARMIVNREWARLIGRGLVEPVDDWEHGENRYPDLLDHLAVRFVASGYDLDALVREIVLSDLYGREAAVSAADAPLANPVPRLLRGGQVVDAIAGAFDKPLTRDELNFDLDHVMPPAATHDYGIPRRGWEMVSLSNERDRPSLAKPDAQTAIDVMLAFGWRDARMEGRTPGPVGPDVTQAAILANGPFTQRMTRLTPAARFTRLAAEAGSPGEFVEEAFLRLLARRPTAAEREAAVATLADGFPGRVVGPVATRTPFETRPNPAEYASWSNHLALGANAFVGEAERSVYAGPEPTAALEADWRERCEDLLWAIVNTPEMVVSP